MKFRYRLLFFLIGVAGIVILFMQLNQDNTPWNELFSVNSLLLFAVIFALWFIIYTVHTLTFYIILGKDRDKIGFFSLLKIVVSGFALNSVTPAGLVGGEPYRIMELKRYTSVEKASSSTLTFTLFYVVAHALIWCTSAVIYLCLGAVGETYITVIMIGAGVVCAIFVTVFCLSKRKGIVAPFMRFLSKLPFLKKPIGKLVEKNSAQYNEIDDNMKAFRTNPKRFWGVLAMQYLSRLLEAVEYMIIIYYFGYKLTFIEGVMVYGMTSLIGNLIFFIPMQAGAREGGLFIALSVLGIAGTLGTVVNIVYRTRDLICILIGIVMVLVSKKSRQELKQLEQDKK